MKCLGVWNRFKDLLLEKLLRATKLQSKQQKPGKRLGNGQRLLFGV